MDGDARIAATTRPEARCGQLATPPALAPSVLLVGASTGGPQALTALVAGLTAVGATLPICVTLHMPAEMMPVIAAHISRACGAETCVVTRPCQVAPGVVYFSPGDRHLILRRGAGRTVELDLRASAEQPSCKPAIDVMFESAACLGARTLAVVLSGMGRDGLAGARAIVAAGGHVLVQDKITSAVWGMPGAIAKAELAAAILSPTGLAVEIARRLARGPRR